MPTCSMSRQDVSLSRKQVAVDPAYAEVVEGVAEEFAHGFGGVAMAGVGRIEDPAEFCVCVAGLVDDVELSPGVFAAQHEVAESDRRPVLVQQDSWSARSRCRPHAGDVRGRGGARAALGRRSALGSAFSDDECCAHGVGLLPAGP